LAAVVEEVAAVDYSYRSDLAAEALSTVFRSWEVGRVIRDRRRYYLAEPDS